MAKKKKINVPSGLIHVSCSPNNTIVSATDPSGNVLCWASSGTVGFKGFRKKTPYSAGVAADKVAKTVKEMGMGSVKMYLKGTGRGKDTTIRSFANAGITITEINEKTPIPHNGCKPPKRPR
ncbi:30S ribosomal protein S11 [Mycoplasmoides genitalium]|uniref:Small ribosomal subunit protein uS11 n=2 Tax=Mycoplasmoides genitalium TaxID=2097 RepID=RS11_MYCGE|nr:30S ribosomal protein S11 [Mycoplasmoides genitalium]P47422.2 RecName: Full=Small ribosomal subunit protein uS11; AltName: Full=30S ribosomal protein S11 [Mycoplasmoides genitalium G37]ABY79525.1 ribosomal protein S11 [synthetic Mycoplasma genitalium JCVI-1.0]AAC71395.2 ribosomal protein S11 [Mycoplasmoides genitalium G37]AFQ03000.1 30S ribosomal protein S11 [Mycoplasmoides genitalium M2321]AFQ03488.1 30S ribosomal protein S11 [Mycoplasmoides genitalium M6282]AFQ03989.1 30S ribosomal prote